MSCSPRCVPGRWDRPAERRCRARRVPTSGRTRSESRARRSISRTVRNATARRGTVKVMPPRTCSPGPATSRPGKFKVRTTPSGALPTHQDLVNIIRRGMPYTSMPAWPTPVRPGSVGSRLLHEDLLPDFSVAENVPKPVELPSAPAVTNTKTIELGKKLYEENGCLKCHGALGRGDGPSASTLVDDLGHSIRAANLTQPWTFRGGSVPRGHLQDDDHGAQRHADALVRRRLDARATMGDHRLHRLSFGERRAWLYQPRRRQALAGSDRSGEGGRELRVRSCRPLSDHRTDHGARALVSSSRHLRDRSGDLRC